jgi:hypothetical protein
MNHIAKEDNVFIKGVGSWSESVCPPNILLVDEELVEVRYSTHQSQPEDASWGSESETSDEISKTRTLQVQSSLLSKASPYSRNHEPRSSQGVTLP